MVIYRVNTSMVSSAKQIDDILRAAATDANVEFTVGIIRAHGENHELATVTLTAR
jgi:hypothetical protein